MQNIHENKNNDSPPGYQNNVISPNKEEDSKAFGMLVQK